MKSTIELGGDVHRVVVESGAVEAVVIDVAESANGFFGSVLDTLENGATLHLSVKDMELRVRLQVGVEYHFYPPTLLSAHHVFVPLVHWPLLEVQMLHHLPECCSLMSSEDPMGNGVWCFGHLQFLREKRVSNHF